MNREGLKSGSMRFSRDNNSILTNWWFTVDRVLLAAILTLMGVGVLVSLAASPAVAVKRGLEIYHFVERHVIFTTLSGMLMLGISLLSPKGVRRLAVLLLFLGAGSLVAVLLIGKDVNGATRWLRLAGYSLQPSEFYKPAFVVAVAGLFSWYQPGRPSSDVSSKGWLAGAGPVALAIMLYLVSSALLLAQPDVGQTILLSVVWGILFLLSGQPLQRVFALAGVGLAGLVAAYASFVHVRVRIDRFFDPGSGDTYQADRAAQSFLEGGFFGRGPGEGTIKTVLPDAHTDYVFAVIAEEYGIVACLALLALFVFIALRGLSRAWNQPDRFSRIAAVGLICLFALQAAINMGVNVGLLPPKGMTLPFLSAGGSSILSLGIMMGMILALTRQRAGAGLVKKPGFVSMTAEGFPAAAVVERTLDDMKGERRP